MSKVLFWTASDDGSSWYRAALPAESLRWEGHLTGAGQQVAVSTLEEADVIVASRLANVESTKLWQALAARPAGERPKLVLDLDDAYFAIDPGNPAAAQWDDAQLNRLARNMWASDLVTVASEGLREHIEASVPAPHHLGKEWDIRVVPNGLHAGWLGTPRDYAKKELTIGWSGTASSSKDFDLVAQALAKIVTYGDGDIKLRLVGLPQNHPGVGVLGRAIPKRLHDQVEAVAWVQHGQDYLSAVAGFDIQVAPYRPGPFNEAKFPTKALETGFLGIPLIASNIRPYRDWFAGAEPEANLLVDEHKPWMWGKYLKALVDSEFSRRAAGEAARSRAALNIMQSVGQQWAATLGLKEAL